MNSYVKVKQASVVANARVVIMEALKASLPRAAMINAVITYINYGKRIVRLVVGFHQKVVAYKKLLFRQWEKFYPEIITELLDVKVDVAS